MNRRQGMAAIIAVVSTGCASTPMPKDYAPGPTATLRDTVHVPAGAGCGDFFFLYEYDGKTIDNAITASANENAGNGMVLAAAHDFSRPILARQADLHIAGRTHCAAPIMEMVGTVNLVDGHVQFAPEANAVYVIKGELGADHSAVWIEAETTGLQIGNKFLVNGPAKAGFFGPKNKATEIPPKE